MFTLVASSKKEGVNNLTLGYVGNAYYSAFETKMTFNVKMDSNFKIMSFYFFLKINSYKSFYSFFETNF